MVQVTGSVTWRSGALTHTGPRHRENQDACLDHGAAGLWAVADGMGGHADGGTASRMVCAALAQIRQTDEATDLVAEVESVIAQTNRTLFAQGAAREDAGTIGTTVAALAIHSGLAICLWCGDSRIYLVRDREVYLLTRDHTVVQSMLDRGELDAEQARNHPAGNVILRAVGARHEIDIERSALELYAGDRFVLATDGLTRHVSTRDLGELVADDPDESVRALVDLALARGTRDDVTALAVFIDHLSEGAPA